MLVTAAVVSVVLVVDDGTIAGSDDADPSAQSGDPSASATPTPRPDPTAGQAPHLDALGVIQTTGVSGATVALTFDDGPSPEYTPRVLDILDDHQVRATFCLTGTGAKAHPEVVKDIAERGHALCDHTISHDLGLSERDDERIRSEIGGTLDYIHAVVPEAKVKFFRAPGGNFAANVNAVATSYGQAPLGWSVDPRDWTESRADAVRTTVLAEVVPGSIVLLHDGGGDQTATVAALGDIISALRDAGYEFVIPTP
jgi:peptidoglycan-N-acetylglucosamine deacetylase